MLEQHVGLPKQRQRYNKIFWYVVLIQEKRIAHPSMEESCLSAWAEAAVRPVSVAAAMSLVWGFCKNHGATAVPGAAFGWQICR